MNDARIPRAGTGFFPLLPTTFVSAILASLSFPGPLVPRGLGFLAWVALVPAFAGLGQAGILASIPAGAVYGAVFTLCSEYWIASYAPSALAFVAILTALQFAMLFPLLSVSLKKTRFAGPILAAAVWAFLEYLRSRGSLAFPFGALGLSQYDHPFMTGLAASGGVYGLSFLVVLANGMLGSFLHAWSRGKGDGRRERTGTGLSSALARVLPSALLLALLVVVGSRAGAGQASPAGPGGRSLRVALVQHNRGKQDDIRGYREAYERLAALTSGALADRPDLVIWPESAIIPSINWHLAFREDREAYELCRDIGEFAASLPCPLLFGNDLAETRPGGTGRRARVDRNAAILWQGKSSQSYAKTLLVPFAEEVPRAFEGTLVGDYALRLSNGGWTRGDGARLLVLAPVPTGKENPDGAGKDPIAFGSPICFEDGFGDYALGFRKLGASFLAVLTSDAWSASAACEYQHLAQSVFRAAETGLPLVRAATSGITAFILPGGRIAGELPPFTEAVLLAELPLDQSRATPYSKAGDRPLIALGLAALLAIGLVFLLDLRKRHAARTAGPASH